MSSSPFVHASRQGLSDAFDLADDEGPAEDAHEGHAADEDEGGGEVVAFDEDADDEGDDDAHAGADEVEGAAGETGEVAGGDGGYDGPGDGGETAAEKSEGHETDDHPGFRDVVGADEGGGEEHAGDDGELAGDGEGDAAAEHEVGEVSGEEDSDPGGEEGEGGEEADLEKGHVAVGDEVGWEPGEEEPVGAGLAHVGEEEAPHLAVLEGDAGGDGWGFGVVPGGLAAAIADEGEFGWVGAAFAGFAIEEAEDEGPGEAGETGDDEHAAPAELGLEPDEDRGEEGEAYVLAGDVGADGHGAFTFGDPGGDDAVVHGVGGDFADADAEADDEELPGGGGEALEGGEEGPGEDGDGVEHAGHDAVDEHGARDLQGGVGPGEGGEDEAHLGGREVEAGGDGGAGDGDAAAVDVVDDDADEEEADDQAAGGTWALHALPSCFCGWEGAGWREKRQRRGGAMGDVAVRVEAHVVEVTAKTRWIFVEITTAEGLVGCGEGSLNTEDGAVLRAIEGLVPAVFAVGDVAPAVFPVPGCLAEAAAVSAVDQALWDLLGQRAGMSVAEALGGRQREAVRLYANINRRTRDRSPAGFAASARTAMAAGVQGVQDRAVR